MGSRTTRTRSCRLRAGFSLLELVIILVILATLGAIAPRYATALDRYYADATALQ